MKKDIYINLRAQMFMELRNRFRKTHEHVTGIKQHDIDDMIKIPRNNNLIDELSQPTFSRNTAGKWKIESKDDMKRRGIKSGNLADALAMCYLGGYVHDYSIYE